MNYRGVILAGGKGTRLGERTRATNKHLLPVGPEPMIHWPIKKLVGAGVRDILIVTGPGHVNDFIALLGTGQTLGCTLSFQTQIEAGGIAQALGLAETFVGAARSIVLLGDNIFHDPLTGVLADAAKYPDHAWATLKKVPDPSRYGVAVFDQDQLIGIEEKPARPASDFAVTGIYLYPPDVFDIIRTLKPSARGELEITGVNQAYLAQARLGYSYWAGYWTDAGTPESLALADRLVTETPPRFV